MCHINIFIGSSDKDELDKQVNYLLGLGCELKEGGYYEDKQGFIEKYYFQTVVIDTNKYNHFEFNDEEGKRILLNNFNGNFNQYQIINGGGGHVICAHPRTKGQSSSNARPGRRTPAPACRPDRTPTGTTREAGHRGRTGTGQPVGPPWRPQGGHSADRPSTRQSTARLPAGVLPSARRGGRRRWGRRHLARLPPRA